MDVSLNDLMYVSLCLIYSQYVSDLADVLQIEVLQTIALRGVQTRTVVRGD